VWIDVENCCRAIRAFEALNLKIGEDVFVVPKRVRVFTPEYMI